MNYHQREELKAEGWQEAYDADLPIEDRAVGLLKVIEAHFERSVSTYRKRKPRHGTFEEFAASWLAANGDSFAALAPLIRHLQKLYPPPRHPMISMGRSYWGT